MLNAIHCNSSFICQRRFKNSITKNINLDVYYIFAQSFDNLTYYNFFKPWQDHKINKLGHLAQRTKTNDYFKNILDYIVDNNYQNNPDLLAYFYGSICHYVLDSICHPFIIYQSGYASLAKKYQGLHEKNEVMIDAIMYQEKTHQKLKNASLASTLLPKIKFSKELLDCLDYTFLKTYNTENMGKIYHKSYQTGHFILKFFVTDHTGLKKQIYKIKDLFGPKRYQYLSFHLKKLDRSILNEEKEQWVYPTNSKIKKNASFYDLYNEALKEADNLIKTTDKYFKKQITLDKLLKEFKNKSYVTGLNWEEKSEFKNFKF